MGHKQLLFSSKSSVPYTLLCYLKSKTDSAPINSLPKTDYAQFCPYQSSAIGQRPSQLALRPHQLSETLPAASEALPAASENLSAASGALSATSEAPN